MTTARRAQREGGCGVHRSDGVDMVARGEEELQTDLRFDIVFAGSGKGQHGSASPVSCSGSRTARPW
jgi:hypothetical protein